MTKHKTNKTPQFKKRDFLITAASISDGKCNYEYRITDGTGTGDIHKVKGVGIHYDDLTIAFDKFNAHMADIDDTFRRSGKKIQDINKMHNDELTALFSVTGFQIKGDENESIILKATKQIECSGERMDIQTPKIPIDNLSSYKHWEELKEAADQVREEVALYKEGKCTNPEPEEEDNNQLSLGNALSDLDLENAKVK